LSLPQYTRRVHPRSRRAIIYDTTTRTTSSRNERGRNGETNRFRSMSVTLLAGNRTGGKEGARTRAFADRARGKPDDPRKRMGSRRGGRGGFVARACGGRALLEFVVLVGMAARTVAGVRGSAHLVAVRAVRSAPRGGTSSVIRCSDSTRLGATKPEGARRGTNSLAQEHTGARREHDFSCCILLIFPAAVHSAAGAVGTVNRLERHGPPTPRA